MNEAETEYLDNVKTVLDKYGGRYVPADIAFHDITDRRFCFRVGKLRWESMPNEKWIGWRTSDNCGIGNVNLFVDQVIVPRTGANLDQEVILQPDGLLKQLDIILPLRAIRNEAELLFEFPDHYYVFPFSADWCFNYTFEGYLYFGFARDIISADRRL